MHRFTACCSIVLMSAFGLLAGDVSDAQRRIFDAQTVQPCDPDSLPPRDAFVIDACANGDFEAGLDTWSGAYGNVAFGTDDPDLRCLHPGLLPGNENGPLAQSTSRHTVVRAVDGPDPIAGIELVAPGGSTRAVRIGNTAIGGGVELLERTFVVRADRPSIGFWYAVVLQDPRHEVAHQPLFRVRVTDAHGDEITGVVDLDPGVARIDRLTADSMSPLFTVLPKDIVYRDWTCAYIDLTGHVGKTVTVQFIVEDCSELGHWGYAYIDRFCDTDCAIGFGPAESTNCGAGQLCFHYALPRDDGVAIRLAMLRDGVVSTTIASPILTSGTSYCFPIDDPAAAFDYVATATFSSGAVRSVGVAPEGVTAGLNNDYTAEPCCGFGANLVRNGDFESGTDFSYKQTPASPSAVLPGESAVIDAIQAATISPTWIVSSHEACNSTGKFLAVNGDTRKTGSRMVWSQTISVTPTTGYQFCVYLRNLEQCALDVKPKVELRFSSPPDRTNPSTIIADSCSKCDWKREKRRIVIPAGVVSLTAEIWLDESGEGDGNDLAIDDISLKVNVLEIVP